MFQIIRPILTNIQNSALRFGPLTGDPAIYHKNYARIHIPEIILYIINTVIRVLWLHRQIMFYGIFSTPRKGCSAQSAEPAGKQGLSIPHQRLFHL